MKKLTLIFSAVTMIVMSQSISFSQSVNLLQFSEPEIYGYFGYSVRSAGDVNGDGYDDIIIGALGENSNTGGAYIYFGGENMDTLSDVVFEGESEYTDLGISVSGAGDVNGDGYSDVIIGASRINSFKGRAYICYGGLNMDNTPDVVLNGEALGSDFGNSVGGGDVNGDGYSDLIIGASGFSNEFYFRAGRVYVYFGGTIMDTVSDVVFTGESSYSELGISVAGAGDLNGDGFCDVASGAYYYNLGLGRAYVHFGSSDMDNIPDVIMTGVLFDDNGLGVCIAGAGDINNDGYDDLLAGDGYTNYIGKAKLYYGGANMDNVADKIFLGESNNDWFAGWGSEVSRAGDINGDGYGDIIIGAHGYANGKAYVYFGGDNMDTDADLTFNGEDGYGNFGFSVANAGDINSDNQIDLLIGAHGSQHGKAYLYYNINSDTSMIRSVTPMQNAVSVNRSSDIEVVFTQSMDASTLIPANIKVNAELSGVLPVLISYNPATKSMRIDPQTDFKAGEKVFVTLTSGVQTEGDNSITPFTYSFFGAVTGGSGSFRISDSIDISGNVKAGDIDGDGDIDIIAGHSGNGIKIYMNIGFGHFEFASVVAGATAAFELEDFDADGDLDIASSDENNLIKLFINNGSGTFSHTTSSVAILGKAGDFDGDGDPDMANVYSGFDIQIVKNENTVFNNADTIHVSHDCQQQCYPMSDIEIDDYDNDGDIDILLLHFTACEEPFVFFGCRKADLFKNDGFGRFSRVTIYEANVGPDEGGILDENFMTSVNFDGDEDLDLLISEVKMANDGSGIFSNSPFSIQFHYVKKSVLDINGDGSLDFTQDGGGQYVNLGFRINDGLGSFHEGQTIHNFGDLKCFGDFDGDGDIDLYSQWNNKGYIYLNEDCLISGPSQVPVFSDPVIYTVANAFGFWSLSNYDLTQAAIVSGVNDDSVLVDPGSAGGHFVLYYQDINRIICSKHVYVDDPLPVDLASFTSAINGRNVTLNWSTVSELNNSGFDIEKSIVRGQTSEGWSKIGFINGNGTINEQVNYTFTDKNLLTGKYKYRLKQIDFNGNFEYFELAEEVSIGIPDKFELSQNYPNPFNPVTNLEFGISNLGFVTLKIYDVLGRELVTLVNEIKEPGYYKIQFNASDLANGVYFYRMIAGLSGGAEEFVAVKKLVVLK